MNVKDELQGATGLLLKLRKAHMPQGLVIAQEAIRNLGYTAEQIEKEKMRKNFNSLLFDILIEEWNIFQKYEKELYKSRIIPAIFELINNGSPEFPVCQAAIQDIIASIERNRNRDAKWFITFLSESLFEYFEALLQSIHQSRRTRAGGSFQYQIENLFNLAGFPFSKQTSLNGPVDFLLPSEDYYRQYRHDAYPSKEH